MTSEADILISGGGLNGMTLALALASAGVSTLLVEAGDPTAMQNPKFDGRTTAIASATQAMFEALGLGEALDGGGCPITRISVSDRLRPGSLSFEAEGDDVHGFMYENSVLRRVLNEAVEKEPLITRRIGCSVDHDERDSSGVRLSLGDGSEVSGKLLIVAEGRGSRTRERAGFHMAEWDYPHMAVIGAILHERPHDHTAYEIFFPEGPFALLPMNDMDGSARSAFVWSVPREKAQGYMKSPDPMFLELMQEAMNGIFGRIALAAPRMAYPLGYKRSAKMIDTRLALLGDAAHGIHPIAGQGLNLGLRDVATLAQVVVEAMRMGMDPGEKAVLARYERWRSLDALSIAGSTDLLTRLFGIRGNVASAIRRAGLATVDRAGGLKGFFAAEARGIAGSTPRLLVGEPI